MVCWLVLAVVYVFLAGYVGGSAHPADSPSDDGNADIVRNHQHARKGVLVPRQATFALSLQRHMRGTIDPRRGGWVRWRALRWVRRRANAMTGIEASASPPPLPRW